MKAQSRNLWIMADQSALGDPRSNSEAHMNDVEKHGGEAGGGRVNEGATPEALAPSPEAPSPDAKSTGIRFLLHQVLAFFFSVIVMSNCKNSKRLRARILRLSFI